MNKKTFTSLIGVTLALCSCSPAYGEFRSGRNTLPMVSVSQRPPSQTAYKLPDFDILPYVVQPGDTTLRELTGRLCKNIGWYNTQKIINNTRDETSLIVGQTIWIGCSEYHGQ